MKSLISRNVYAFSENAVFSYTLFGTSHTGVPDFEINDCLVMAVPKVDIGPKDLSNYLCLIVEKKKLYKLRTKHGMMQ